MVNSELKSWWRALKSPSGRRATKSLFGKEFADNFYRSTKPTLKKGK